MLTVLESLAAHILLLKGRWEDYVKQPGIEQFSEFTLALSSMTEQSKDSRLPGLSRLCEGVRNQVLLLSAQAAGHPLPEKEIDTLARQVKSILASAESSRFAKTEERRIVFAPMEVPQPVPARPRNIWLVTDPSHPWFTGLSKQLAFFGFRVHCFDWHLAAPEGESPLVILFIPASAYSAAEIDCLKHFRAQHPASQLVCLDVPELLEPMVILLRAGADVTIPETQLTTTVVAQVLDLIEVQDQEPYRVLVVDDSLTAVALIRRTLSRHGIDNLAINNPEELLDAIGRYRPDLVLMDMHMPHCTGIEATRVLRQIPTWQSLPVVYLSSETDMSMQVAALHLGGDQFINKPFNPVLLTTIVKTRIERYREMQRSSQHDGLTGLLNHTTSKTRLNQLIHALDVESEQLCVAMLDIDRFKLINDVYGHPVGDQVIRNLAWLLKGRLRTSDVIGRYGGEEFLVVLRGIGLDDAFAILDRIRVDFMRLPHNHSTGTLSSSFSAGIAAFPAFATGKQLIDAADNALLKAKAQGRNRIERAAE
ncbi:MAG: diguanylate cyclase [Pseudomonadota bacterium]